MEEFVGELWHRIVTRVAQREYPQATVTLDEIERSVGLLFRAFGGDSGLRVAPSADLGHSGRQRFLQRMAHTGHRTALAARDTETLHLPPYRTLPHPGTQPRFVFMARRIGGTLNGIFRQRSMAGRQPASHTGCTDGLPRTQTPL